MSGKAAGRVSAETEKVVRRAAADLGYRPNAAARALRTGAARSVALIVPDVTNPFFGQVMRGAQAAAWDAGYAVALVDTANDPAWELGSYEALQAGSGDGFLVFGVVQAPRRRRGRGGKLVVTEAETPGHLSVILDGAGGADAVMEHLLGLGHRRIGRIAAPVGRPAFRIRDERWRAALAAAGVDPDAMPYARSEIRFAAARAAALELLAAEEPPTAIFCDDDNLAGGAYLGARELGRRIPHDVSIVGFDDLDFVAVLDPPLTTVTADAAAPRRARLRDARRAHGRRAGRAGADAAGAAHDPRLDGRAAAVIAPSRCARRAAGTPARSPILSER